MPRQALHFKARHQQAVERAPERQVVIRKLPKAETVVGIVEARLRIPVIDRSDNAVIAAIQVERSPDAVGAAEQALVEPAADGDGIGALRILVSAPATAVFERQL